MKKTVVLVWLLATLCSCPSTSGKLRVVNNSSYVVTNVAAWSIADEYWIQLFDYNIEEEHIQPGEAKLLEVEIEGYYNLHAGNPQKTWGKSSIYFGPGTKVTWTLGDDGNGDISN
jgi:hypothetical protein